MFHILSKHWKLIPFTAQPQTRDLLNKNLLVAGGGEDGIHGNFRGYFKDFKSLMKRDNQREKTKNQPGILVIRYPVI